MIEIIGGAYKDWIIVPESHRDSRKIGLSVRRFFSSEFIHAGDLAGIEILNAEDQKRLAGTAVGAGVGLAVAGGAGLLVGALVGGKNSEVTLLITLKDGRRMMAKCKALEFQKLQAVILDYEEAARATGPVAAPPEQPNLTVPIDLSQRPPRLSFWKVTGVSFLIYMIGWFMFLAALGDGGLKDAADWELFIPTLIFFGSIFAARKWLRWRALKSGA